MLCQDCTKRNTCTELCKEAEEYANQDYVGRQESYLTEGDVSEVFENEPAREWPESTKSTKEIIFSMYFEDRLKQAQIAEKLNVSKQYVSSVVREAKAKIAKM